MIRLRGEARNQPVVQTKSDIVVGGVFELSEGYRGVLILLGQRGLQDFLAAADRAVDCLIEGRFEAREVELRIDLQRFVGAPVEQNIERGFVVGDGDLLLAQLFAGGFERELGIDEIALGREVRGIGDLGHVQDPLKIIEVSGDQVVEREVELDLIVGGFRLRADVAHGRQIGQSRDFERCVARCAPGAVLFREIAGTGRRLCCGSPSRRGSPANCRSWCTKTGDQPACNFELSGARPSSTESVPPAPADYASAPA